MSVLPVTTLLPSPIPIDGIVIKANSDARLCRQLVEAIFHLKGLDHQIILNHMRDAHTVRNAWVRCYLMGLKSLGNSS